MDVYIHVYIRIDGRYYICACSTNDCDFFVDVRTNRDLQHAYHLLMYIQMLNRMRFVYVYIGKASTCAYAPIILFFHILI